MVTYYCKLNGSRCFIHSENDERRLCLSICNWKVSFGIHPLLVWPGFVTGLWTSRSKSKTALTRVMVRNSHPSPILSFSILSLYLFYSSLLSSLAPAFSYFSLAPPLFPSRSFEVTGLRTQLSAGMGAEENSEETASLMYKILATLGVLLHVIFFDIPADIIRWLTKRPKVTCVFFFLMSDEKKMIFSQIDLSYPHQSYHSFSHSFLSFSYSTFPFSHALLIPLSISMNALILQGFYSI